MNRNHKFWVALHAASTMASFDLITEATTKGGAIFWTIILLINLWGLNDHYKQVVNISDLSEPQGRGSGFQPEDRSPR